MLLLPVPRWLVGYIFLFSLCMLLIRFLEPQSSWHLLYDIVDSQIQRGVSVNVSSSSAKLDPLNSSTYLQGSSIDPAGGLFTSPLTQCSRVPNPFTSHIRLSIQYLNISLTPPGSTPASGQYFNPSLLRLPSWTVKSSTANGAKYVFVTRAVTEGLHQEAFICLADICLPHQEDSNEVTDAEDVKSRPLLPPDARTCNPSDQTVLGTRGGMRCTTPPIRLNIPPTPALRCTGSWAAFPHIAGFHDPRVFWSGQGEPLIILNSASQYGCVGLWLLDLRTVYPDLAKVLSRDDKKKAWELPTISYKHLTELTRIERSEVEKNWMLFFPGSDGEAIIQYDALPRYQFSVDQRQSQPSNNASVVHAKRAEDPISSSGGRTLARLIGAGRTTPNITHSQEATCFPPASLFDSRGDRGHWHQSTNALKLILCTRLQHRDGTCGNSSTWTEEGREVHFSIIHRKFSNELDLPMRYERFVVVWKGKRPYRVVGVSKWPILFAGEKVRPWSESENWPGGDSETSKPRKVRNGTMVDELRGKKRANETESMFRRQIDDEESAENGRREKMKREEKDAYFTYTPSLTWAWRPTPDHFEEGEGDIEELERLGMGFLGDELLVGIGLDDVEQVFVRVRVDEIVGCLRLC